MDCMSWTSSSVAIPEDTSSVVRLNEAKLLLAREGCTRDLADDELKDFVFLFLVAWREIKLLEGGHQHRLCQ